jgi:1,5-anhydro-D-fructose reductase (1,5-anhydro-D-mannitol-forming)
MTNLATASTREVGQQPLSWALIGASTIAATYMIDAIRNAPGGSLVGVLSSDAKRGADYAARHEIPRVYGSMQELCADPDLDVVYISTANDRHAASALAAIAAGKHVLCEKPLAVSPADAQAVVDAAAGAEVTLGVNHHLRAAPAHLKVKELVAGGRIGRVLGARVFHGTELPLGLRTWRTSRPGAGAGAALDLTVHGADLLRFLLEDEIEQVAAISARQGVSAHPDVEDALAGVLCLRSGALCTFHDAFTMPYVATCVELYGDAGSIRIEDAMLDDPVATVSLRDRDGTHGIEVDQSEGLYERTVRVFNEAVRGIGAPIASGEDGVCSLLVAIAATTSAREGRSVSLAESANQPS